MISVPRQLLIQAIFIAINAIFAALEMAMVSLSTTRLKMLEEEGDKAAIRLLKMLENPAGFLSAIQVAISLSGFLGSAFAADSLSEPLTDWFISLGLTMIPYQTLNSISVVIITIILTLVTIIFGELVPKRIAQQKSYEVAKVFMKLLMVISTILKPIIWFTSSTTNLILRILHLKTSSEDESVSEAEIRMMVDAGSDNGTIEEDEKEMIQNIFEFNDIKVSEIMTRIGDVNYFSVDDDEETIIRTIKESGNSRYPVYEDDINNIIGILNARDFLININDGRRKSLREMLRSAYFVPESIKADQLFSDMQKKKVHIAIVIDEYGETRGIVTLEDLLEEIVGNIYDEFDEAEAPEIEKIGENRWRVSGTLTIEDLEDELGIDIPDDRDYGTVGGMVFSCLHEIPEDGQTFTVEIHGLRITVTKVEDKRIAQAEIEKIEKDEACEEDEKKKED
ncbi:MAG: HlyC/CorC family transporter [Spirochaetes bacterium]|uniref:HlyC/CorC family transporter n=1 Tax=Candidatus Aphodenecus pullistercoris TaxID=2840669 RepID=A0A9D9E7J6_9SPIR|nr:HlyC/CorC family transporter [Candidatus Aphodenecus pullistercoris]